MSDSTIIQPGVPVRFAWKNFRRGYSDRRGQGVGAIYKIEVEVLPEDWATLETMPRNADGEMVMWFTETGGSMDEPKKTRQKASKGEYGALWARLHVVGFFSAPGVMEALQEVRGEGYEAPHILMRRVFGVESLSRSIGPDQICAKFPAAKVLVDQAVRYTQEREAKQ